MLFTTHRLIIRPLEKGDLPRFHRMQCDNTVMRYVGGSIESLEENRKDLERCMAFYDKVNNDFWVWAVVSKERHTFIGTCALVTNKEGEWEMGYRFLQSEWGKGYGREVVNGLIRHAFETMKVKEVVAYTDKRNAASVRILDSTFKFIREFYNQDEDCIDRFYKLSN